MMLPILISVSVAPESYFFWASALPPVVTKATSAAAAAASRSFARVVMVAPFCCLLLSSLPEFADQLLGNDGHLPCAMRHEEDHDEQQDAEHGAGEALGDALGNVRHEDDEGGAHERARQPADAADHHAEKQADGLRDGVAVGRGEVHRDYLERPGNAGDPGTDAECQRLVEGDVDAHGGGGDLVVRDRHEEIGRAS